MEAFQDVVDTLLPIRIAAPEFGVVLVDPPTVRQAMLLHGLLPYWETPSYHDRIERILDEWWGDAARKTLSKYLDLRETVHTVRRVLKSCEPLMEEAKEGEAGSWERDRDIHLLIAEYRHWYGVDAMTEPWPLFLAQATRLTKLKAEVGLANLTWYSAAKVEGAANDLMKLAGYRKAELPDSSEASKQAQLSIAEHIGILAAAEAESRKN